MKKVFELSINGEFRQYLMLSEARLITALFNEGDKITLTCVQITKEHYNRVFGKD